ncbi:erg26, C-3 sterol dehydrogenase [Talaromyces marneffei ATCC 18224]
MEPSAQQSGPIKHKRNRTAQSCVQCRQRKVRCDRGYPCAPCLRSKSSLECSYDKRNPPQGNSSSKNSSILEHRAGRPTRQETHLSSSYNNRINENAAAVTIQPGAAAQSQRLIEDLQEQVQQLKEAVSGSVYATQNSSPSGLPVGANKIEEQPIKAPTSHLRNTWDKTKIYGPNNWIHTAGQFQVLGEFISSDVSLSAQFCDKTELVNLLKECLSLKKLYKKHSFDDDAPLPTDISSTFPQKFTCDELVQCYLKTLEPIYRILHVPSFMTEYEIFWKEARSVPKHFKMKMALVLAIGSAFHAIQNDWTYYENTVQNWVRAAQLWLAGASNHANLTNDGLQIGCLLILSRCTCPATLPTWISTASLLQMGMMMGLHRDSSLFPSLNPFQAEMRNRLWTTIIELSIQALLDSGVPLPLSLAEFDSRNPCNINDQDISPGSKEATRPKDGHIFTDSSIQILLSKSISTRLEIARLLNDPQRKNLTFEKAMRLGQELRTACREISAFFQRNTPTSQRQESGKMEFHRKFLDMYLHRYILFLYRPFMIEARKDPRYYLARKMCVESCLIIASHSEDGAIDPSTKMSDYLPRLTRVGSGTFKGPFCMDVIAILSLELVIQVEEENSIRISGLPMMATVDPLGEMNKANRAPLIRCLERIKAHLEQIIVSGRVSLKRYGFLVGALSLVRAIDCGLPIRQTIFEDITATLRKYYSYLSEHPSDQPRQEPVGEMAVDSGDMPELSTFFPTDDWDPSSVVFPDFFNLLEPSSMRW